MTDKFQAEAYKDYVPKVEEYTVPRVVSIKTASVEFGISVCAIRRWIKSGQLPVVKCGHSFLINCTVFSKFLEGECQPVTVEPPQKPVAIGENGELFADDEPSKRKRKVSRIKPIY